MATPRARHRSLGVTHAELTMEVEAKERNLAYLATVRRKQELGFVAVLQICTYGKTRRKNVATSMLCARHAMPASAKDLTGSNDAIPVSEHH